MSDNTRRSFLKSGLAGIAAASTLPALKPSQAEASITPPQANHPFGYPYAGFGLEETEWLGYEGYKGTSRYTWKGSDENRHCAAATFTAILGQLQDLDMSPSTNPYQAIPLAMMRWGSGGVAGYGSFCGTLNGAAAAIGLICSESDAKGFISDLMTWYSETALPLFDPTGGSDPYVQSVAASNLCHASVTNWCNASGFASGSPERSERCARLSADVAAKAVQMLNEAMLTGSAGGVLGNPRDNSTVCGECHYKGPDFQAGQFTRGKMNCTSCHSELKKVNPMGHKGNAKI